MAPPPRRCTPTRMRLRYLFPQQNPTQCSSSRSLDQALSVSFTSGGYEVALVTGHPQSRTREAPAACLETRLHTQFHRRG